MISVCLKSVSTEQHVHESKGPALNDRCCTDSIEKNIDTNIGGKIMSRKHPCDRLVDFIKGGVVLQTSDSGLPHQI